MILRIRAFILLTGLSSIFGCAKEYSCEDCILKGPPAVETIQITDVTINSASFHGELLATGGLLISDFGFCWATHPLPDISDNRINKGQTDSLQVFVSNQTGLTENQTYYVRAFAINDSGTVYGKELSFITLADPLKECLIAYYPFNGNTNDESGNNNNGIANGGLLTADKNGIPGKAYSFSGSDYIRVPNSTSLSGISNSFSISAWVYNENPEAYIVCKAADGGPDMQFRLYADGGGIHFANFNNAADFSNTLQPTSSWKHITVTCDGITAKCYINGILVSTSSLHGDPSVSNNNTDMYIGADTHNVTEFFTGKLDEIRIYCRVLSINEINELYNL